MYGNQQRTTARPIRRALLLAVLVATSSWGLAGADATDAELDPQRGLLASASLVFVDGDHVVFQVDDHGDDGAHAAHEEDHADAKGSGESSGPVTHEGFSTYGDAKLLAGYQVRLVASDGVERLRPRVEAAVSAAMANGAPSLTVPPGTVPQGTRLSRGEIHVAVSSSSPCTGSWLGCGGPVIEDGKVLAGRVWINPRLFNRESAQIANTVRHELGHTLGLGHYSSEYEGRIQTMHASRFDASSYESGDRAGFHFVTGKPPPPPSASAQHAAPAPEPEPAPEPRSVDPVGSIESAGSTPFGLAVRGWAFDPDTPAPISVLITIDGVPHEVLASHVRSMGTADGFEITSASPPGTYEVCVIALNVGPGVDTFLGCRTVDVSARSIGWVGLQTL